jgi:glycosyltransferase involved in cell wall biosynthesis
MPGSGRRLLVISARLPETSADEPLGPRKDYNALAQALGADILDRGVVTRSILGRLLCRLAGPNVVQAATAFVRRRAYTVIITDGEHIGIPLALLLKLARDRDTTHVTIGHRLSSPKKRPFFRWLKVHSHIDRIVVHSSRQREIATTRLGIEAERLRLVPYQVDADFWRPLELPELRLVCSAGLEHRDYPTLYRAVERLDAAVVVGAASHFSHQRNTANVTEPPANVEVGGFRYVALRDLYARAAVVVVPLDDVDFQAGVTTVLEAMAMAKPVVVTDTEGGGDIIQDRRAVVRSRKTPPRPVNLLASLAAQSGMSLQPNGFYVPPKEPAALERALRYLLDHPEERARLGAAGRRAVVRLLTIDHFAQRMRSLVDEALASHQTTPPAADGIAVTVGRR